MSCLWIVAHIQDKAAEKRLSTAGCCPHSAGAASLDLSEAGRKVQEQLPLIASAAMNNWSPAEPEELQTLTHLLTSSALHAGCPRAGLQES
ncbi:hypothetical protein P4123_28030 [Pseudomonas aeruginosa]|nr:hypothetical protein [Pseudomonas aeruginosa]